MDFAVRRGALLEEGAEVGDFHDFLSAGSGW
jgi:hypothetical protein